MFRGGVARVGLIDLRAHTNTLSALRTDTPRSVRVEAFGAEENLTEVLQTTIQQLASEEFHFTGDQLRACTTNDRFPLCSFFQRAEEMEERPREQLALRLADIFLRKLAYQPASPIADELRAETFLASLYRDLENWTERDR
jgi:hypothetical protein